MTEGLKPLTHADRIRLRTASTNASRKHSASGREKQRKGHCPAPVTLPLAHLMLMAGADSGTVGSKK